MREWENIHIDAAVSKVWKKTVLLFFYICFSAIAEKQPNVLLIYVDDVGYGEFGCQGNPQIPTPNIDSIAANGVRFTQGYVTDSLCCPSRAGLMTGRHQDRIGNETNPPWGPNWQDYGLPLADASGHAVKTMADRVKTLGYATGCVGKWHLGDKPEYWPTKRGFDEYYGQLDEENMSYETPRILDSRSANPVPHRISRKGFYSTFVYGEHARDFISRNKDNPWFLYLAFFNQHAPIKEVPSGYAQRFPFTQIKNPRRRVFAQMMTALDKEVGETMSLVRGLGLETNTLVFLISDNGGAQNNTSVNTPLRGTKITQFEGGLRVPYMMQWKGKIPAGKVYENPVSTLDVLPTALAAAGAEISPAWKLEGVDLIPYVTDANDDVPHETLCWRRGSYRTIRQGDWKLLFRKGHPVQLYNLKDDIGENNNRAETFPERVQNLRLRWQAWDQQNVAPLWLSGKYE